MHDLRKTTKLHKEKNLTMSILLNFTIIWGSKINILSYDFLFALLYYLPIHFLSLSTPFFSKTYKQLLGSSAQKKPNHQASSWRF
jgi:hypothetical protein